METANKSTAKYWILTLVFLIITLGMLVFIPAWFWVPLPFLLTYLVMAFDKM